MSKVLKVLQATAPLGSLKQVTRALKLGQIGIAASIDIFGRRDCRDHAFLDQSPAPDAATRHRTQGQTTKCQLTSARGGLRTQGRT